jgi:hypothetical protein
MLVNRVLIKARIRRRVDGWRRGAGLVLRGENSSFVLSAFGLNIWQDASASQATAQEMISRRLAKFLAEEKELHRHVRRTEVEDFAEDCDGPSYTLAFQPPVDGPARFVRPDDWRGENPAENSSRDPSVLVLLNFVCRVRDGKSVDVWVRANHVGIDGVPVQEMMSRLEAAWGQSEKVIFPSPGEFSALESPRPSPGRAGIAEVQTFVDFSPLLAWRKRRNGALPEPMTVSAAILWHLGRHAKLSKLFMGTTVEVPALAGLGRGVGVVVVRPGDYPQRQSGLGDFVRSFNRELNLTRQRRSRALNIIDAAALIPPRLEKELLVRGLEDGRSAFGSIALTMLRDARVFGAPLGDAGHEDGFLAVGSVDLPTTDGKRVGCVTVKGPAARIANYPALLREAIAGCESDEST